MPDPTRLVTRADMIRPAMRTIAAALLVSLTALSVGCGSDREQNAEPTSPQPTGPVTVGEVTAAAAGGDRSAVEALREALGEAAARLSADPRIERDLVLNGGVSRLQHIREGAGLLTVRATVSLSLRDAREGQILVVLEGTAQSGGSAPANDAARRGVEAEVIAGAVDGLIERLGPTLDAL